MSEDKMSKDLEKMKLHSPDFADENIRKIAEIFPNCVTETQDSDGNLKFAIDYDELRQELSDHIVEGPQERYHLNWPGKREALLAANTPITKTLRPVRDESVEFDTTQNLFIEGDNLEALKLLQESYLGKVKMIYIDPPYNRGSDLIYKDSFAESAEDFLLKSEQANSFGERLVSNTDANGRFHSDWLSMMYPRLKIAKRLLRDDGLIFISCDNEFANLRRLTDEVFGEKNFIEMFSWQKTTTPPNLSSKTKKSCEYILAYQSRDSGPLAGLNKPSRGANGLLNQSNKEKELVFPAFHTTTSLKDGLYKAGRYGTESYTINLIEDTKVENGKFILPIKLHGKFKWSQEYLDKSIKQGVKILIQTKAFSPAYEKDEYSPEKPWNIINNNFGVGTNENASDEVDSLFHKNFSEQLYPKPTSLIKYLCLTNVAQEGIVLDFFAGSSTTAHSIMDLNATDGGNRKFIMIQIAEPTSNDSVASNSGFNSIAEISKERIRRAGVKVLEGKCHPDWKKDIGFRVLKVDESNMRDVYYRPDEFDQKDILSSVDNIKPDRTGEDLLFQVLVDWGVDLTLPIRHQKIEGKSVYFIDDDALVACFEKDIKEELVKKLATHKPLRIVFRDQGFARDDLKVNITQIFQQTSPNTDIKVI